MTEQPHRSMLHHMGLNTAPISTEVIAAKSNEINLSYFPHLDRAGKERQIAIAEALETLAASMRKGAEHFGDKEYKQEVIVALGLNVQSELKDGHFLEHEVRIRFEIYGAGAGE